MGAAGEKVGKTCARIRKSVVLLQIVLSLGFVFPLASVLRKVGNKVAMATKQIISGQQMNYRPPTVFIHWTTKYLA